MRKQYVECKSRTTAKRQCPWYSRTMKVVGGYIVFESVEEYETSKKQK
jgi:hypothetical protein